MEKKTSTLIALMVVIVTALSIIVGCKKEKNQSSEQPVSSEAQAILSRIEKFQALREAVNSGAKSNGTMTVEEMRDILDLTTNYEHSEHTTPCANKVLDTLYIAMPVVDAEGNVNETDVVAAYNAFETALNHRMLSINDNLSIASLFSIVMPATNSKNDNNIKIVFLRGEESEENDQPEDPFPEGANWLWGKSLGLCKPEPFNLDLGDASTQLSSVIPPLQITPQPGQIPGVSHVVHVIYRPCEQPIPDIESIYYADSIDCYNTWLFCNETILEHEDCLFYFELNCFYHSIISHIVDDSGPLHYAPTSQFPTTPYYSCYIDWHEYPSNDSDLYLKIHAAHVTYANVIWLVHPHHDD